MVRQPEPVSRDQAAALSSCRALPRRFHLDRLVDGNLPDMTHQCCTGRTERRYDLAGQLLSSALSTPNAPPTALLLGTLHYSWALRNASRAAVLNRTKRASLTLVEVFRTVVSAMRAASSSGQP